MHYSDTQRLIHLTWSNEPNECCDHSHLHFSLGYLIRWVNQQVVTSQPDHH